MGRQGGLPSPDVVSDAATVITTDTALYLMILVATLLLGIAEVLYDNSAQTFLPSIVHADNLEKANGRLWSGELVANTFAGPPLAGLLIAVSFALPFYADAATFAASALLIAFIHPAARNRSAAVASAGAAGAPASTSWRTELAEGFRWLWSHDLLRSLAITLGALNLIGALAAATFVLFGQEVLDTSPTEFAMLGTGGAVGGIVGGWTASGVARRIGAGPSLMLTLVGGGLCSLLIGLMSWWPWVWLLMVAFMFVGTLWNVITVSFRQSVIPDHLLGRVNSVYRFFGWGMMPIGAALGGLIVVIVDQFAVAGACPADAVARRRRHVAAAVRRRRASPDHGQVRSGSSSSSRGPPLRRGVNWTSEAGTARNAHWLQRSWTSPTHSTSSATSATAC